MQSLSRKMLGGIRQGGNLLPAGSVYRVSDQRVANGIQVHADLVGASTFEATAQFRPIQSMHNWRIKSCSRLTARTPRDPGPMNWMAADRGLHRVASCHHAVHNGNVFARE